MAADARRVVPGIRGRAAIPFIRAAALAACCAAVLVAAGCSGKSSDAAGLEIEPGSATFTADENGARPAPQDFAIRIANPSAAMVGAGFVGQQPSWITLDLARTGSGFNLRLTITTTALPAATYRATARVGIADKNQQVLATRDVEIAYTVSPVLRAVASSSLAFTVVEGGAPTAAREVAVTGTGISWTATPSERWLVLSSAIGTGPAVVQVRADPAGLAPGDYTGTITFQAAGLPSVSLTVTLHVEAVALTVEPRLAFSGKMGALLATQPLHLGLNDGGVTAWIATASDPWIVLDHREGVTSDTVLVGVDPAAGPLAIGSHAGTITFTASVGERSLSATVEVSFSLAAAAFTVEPLVSFSAKNGAPLPARTLQLAVDSGAAVAWTATASDPWIVLGSSEGTATPAALVVGVDPSRLPASVGLNSGTLTLSGSVGGQPLSATVKVSVSIEAAAFTAGAGLAFSGKNGVALPAQALQVALDSGAVVPWKATPSDPWIVLERAEGTTPDTLTVRVDPARGPLASGSYTGTVVLEGTLRGQALSATLPVSLVLARPVLTVKPASLELGGALGRDLQAKEVTLALDTATTAHPWKASTGEGWLAPSATAGEVSSTTPATVVVAPQVGGLSGGSRDGTLTFTVTVNGDVLTAALPVRLQLDDHRLLASDTGVAFAKTPTLSSLTRTLRIRDSLGRPTTWTAQASEAWLSVTKAGAAGDELVLTATPTDLAVNTVYAATVDVLPDDPDVAPDQIQVGLWVGAGDPPAAASTSDPFSAVAVDPVRPYAYVHASGSSLTVYNLYTAVPVATIEAVGAQLGSMTVAPDGSKLYAVDRTNFRIVPVDLATRTVGTPIPVGAPAAPSIHAVRTGGHLLLLGGNRCIYDGVTGAVKYPASGCTATPSSGNASAAVSASLAGNIFSIDSIAYRLDYTAVGGGTVVVGQPLSPAITAYNTGDYAFNPDGSRMYLAVGSPYDFYVVDTTVQGTRLPQVQQLPGSAYPNNLEVGKDGRVFAAIDGYADQSGHDAWVFSPDGVLLQSLNLTYYGPALRSLKVSGDGLRMVSIARSTYSTTPGALLFNTVAP